jgi:uncharacterized membrane-anchored protein
VRLFRIFAAWLICSLLPGAPARAAADFDALSREFAYSSLALSPVAATAGDFSLARFHERALREGAVALPTLAELLQ